MDLVHNWEPERSRVTVHYGRVGPTQVLGLAGIVDTATRQHSNGALDCTEQLEIMGNFVIINIS